MPNLCVSCHFNPPVVTIFGASLREDTIRALESQLPLVTSTAAVPNKEQPKFTFVQKPDHWRIELNQQYCNELHKSAMFLTFIEALKQEGWMIRASNSVGKCDSEDTKLFFTRS
ncbi:unnamed protein product [Phytomonas sp. Hart1]|nr:unnamed protein product [Phytomonas sp. Hart1]|eukprot:CCW68136.1 unnamed protein product [Phytomonas sp. isolate Hart1]